MSERSTSGGLASTEASEGSSQVSNGGQSLDIESIRIIQTEESDQSELVRGVLKDSSGVSGSHSNAMESNANAQKECDETNECSSSGQRPHSGSSVSGVKSKFFWRSVSAEARLGAANRSKVATTGVTKKVMSQPHVSVAPGMLVVLFYFVQMTDSLYFSFRNAPCCCFYIV